MAPLKHNRKGKEKMVHGADLIPQAELNKYKVDRKACKILQKSHMWNAVLISKNTKDVLAGIDGLTDCMSDQICEAVHKIKDSLKSQAGVFIQQTVTVLKKARDIIKEDNDHKRFYQTVIECATDFYSLEELLDTLADEFGEDATRKMFELFFSSKPGRLAYLEMSSIRAAQRKAEQNEVGEAIGKIMEKQEAEQKEKLEAEQKEKLEALSQQVTTLRDAFESQEKLFDKLISLQPEFATKEDLDSFEIGISTKLDSLVQDLGIKVGAGIKDIFTTTPPSSNTLEQTVRSELKGALNVLEIPEEMICLE